MSEAPCTAQSWSPYGGRAPSPPEPGATLAVSRMPFPVDLRPRLMIRKDSHGIDLVPTKTGSRSLDATFVTQRGNLAAAVGDATTVLAHPQRMLVRSKK